MITIKGELTKEQVIELLERAMIDELGVGDFEIENLIAENIYENNYTSDFVLKFTVKKKVRIFP